MLPYVRRASLLLAFLAFLPAAHAGLNRWTPIGPHNDTGLRVLLGSTEAPGVLYASQGSPAPGFPPPDALPRPLQKSTDAGRTWTELPVSGVGALAIDPRNSRHLYAVSELIEDPLPVNRVYESADGGLTWRLMATQPFASYTRFNVPRVLGLRVHPADGRILYAATEGGGVYLSTDSGRTWRYSNQGLPVRVRCDHSSCPANAASDLVLDRNPRNLYVIFQGDVYRSTNQGAAWTRPGNGLPKGRVQALAVDPAHPGVLYAAGAIPPTSAGFISAIFKSTDGGRRWTRVAAYPSTVFDLAVSRSGVYASTFADGVFRSTDGGRSWTEVSEGLPLDVSVPLLAPDPVAQGRIYAGTADRGAYSVRFVP